MSANSPSSEDGLCLTDNALIEIFISYDRSVAERFIEGLSGSPSTSNTTGDPTSTQIVEALTLVYESLPASDKKRFDSLHDPGDNGVVSRFKHNSLLLKKADNGYVLCVFEIMVNTRHSCQPNAIVEWSQRCQAWRLLSLKDIEKGEKILICYLAGSFLKTVEERNKELQDRYSFTCTCPACDPNHPNNPNSVERRKQLKTYYDNLDMSKCMIGSGSQCKLENIDEASQSAVIQAYSYRALLEQEGIHDHRVAEAYLPIAQLEYLNEKDRSERRFDAAQGVSMSGIYITLAQKKSRNVSDGGPARIRFKNLHAECDTGDWGTLRNPNGYR